MWMYYLAQIALRKLLNRVHTALYKQEKQALDSPRCLNIARELDFQLSSWKQALPRPLRWEAEEPPATDINAARLRAKYFGARYIIHRPFVYHALHQPDGAVNEDLLRNCRTCIDAAIQSTQAFHAFDPDHTRPVITNVFGTAHA